MKHKIYGNELANMPYEPRPEGCDSPLWRYSNNPIISMNPFPNASRVFNSAVMAYNGEFIGVFRADTKNGIPFLFVGHSKDGIHFDFEIDPIVFHDKEGKPIKLEYAYDPRLVELEGTYYIIFCTSNHGPTLGIGKTKDFKDFELVLVISSYLTLKIWNIGANIDTSWKEDMNGGVALRLVRDQPLLNVI